MTRELHCRDVGFDCDAVVVAESDDDIVRQVVDHAKEIHDMTDEQLSDPNMVEHIRNQIHDEDSLA